MTAKINGMLVTGSMNTEVAGADERDIKAGVDTTGGFDIECILIYKFNLNRGDIPVYLFCSLLDLFEMRCKLTRQFPSKRSPAASVRGAVAVAKELSPLDPKELSPLDPKELVAKGATSP